MQPRHLGRREKAVPEVLLLVATAVLCIAISGCVATVVVPPPRGVVVSGPPPAPIYEERSATTAGQVAVLWVTGYWHWTGLQYTWIPGHWEARRPGAVWQAPRYVRSDGVYVYQPGGWRTGGEPPPRANALR